MCGRAGCGGEGKTMVRTCPASGPKACVPPHYYRAEPDLHDRDSTRIHGIMFDSESVNEVFSLCFNKHVHVSFQMLDF